MNGRRFITAVALGSIAWSAIGFAEPLGRLFFTPEQRQRLDAGKKLQEEAAVAAPPPRQGPATVTLNGVVLRSDGQNTVWVNGHSSNDKASRDVTARLTNDPAAATITVPGSATTKLRVGQRLDTNSGSIRENYARRPRNMPPGNSASSPLPNARTEEGNAQANQDSRGGSSAEQR
jgi:hypothetical protein